MTQEPITDCPVCGEKLLAALKGDDWFVCDNCGTTGEAEKEDHSNGKRTNGSGQVD